MQDLPISSEPRPVRPALVCLVSVTAMAILLGQTPPQARVEQAAALAQANPPLFVANHGQWPSPAAYRIHSAGATAWLEQLDLGKSDSTKAEHQGLRLRKSPASSAFARLLVPTILIIALFGCVLAYLTLS